jgi:2-oxoglutarate ferredoxin oxidoreductase subunit alpha
MHSLLVNEFEIDPAHLIKVLHYDGTPITARFICDAIHKRLESVTPHNRSQLAKESA